MSGLDDDKTKPKDKWTISVSILALIVGFGSFSAAAVSCSTSRDALRTAKQAEKIQESDTSGHILATFALQNVQNGKTIYTSVDTTYSGPLNMSRGDAEAPNTWLNITLTNIGNRVVSIQNVGLATNSKPNASLWVYQKGFDIPDYCNGDASTDRDIRCFSFTYNIEVGKSVVFHWPLLSDWIDPILGNNSGNPITVGLATSVGSIAVPTQLIIG
ncbi:hypothetical protein ACFXPS_42505 [Nocardia sp. NPDC059091]|uniref:hypothetical protein n=1 Tax=unclassified Nocardia TaxID=2637762 RepID=UPI00367B875A